MKSCSLTLLLAAMVARGVAAEFPPALQPLTDQFNKNWQALITSSAAQIAPTRDRYLAVLTATRNAATAAAKTADLAALKSEFDGVQANALPAEPPPDLPKTLLGDRRNYVTTAANMTRTLAPRQRDLASKYVQSLTALEATALRTQDAALSEAVAGEKRRALALLESSGGGAKHRNIIANGDFSQGQDGEMPPGWKKETEVVVADAMLVSEGTNKFLRFRRIEALRRANLMPENEIPIPANTRSAEVSLRMRVKGLVPGTVWNTHPGVLLNGRDGRGEDVAKQLVEAKADTNWKRFNGHIDLPATAKTLKVAIGPHGAAGIFDFDDIEVQFR
jgi:hypothetical protein